MDNPWIFYAKFFGLLVVVGLMVTVNFAVWGVHRRTPAPTLYVPGSNPERGPALIQHYGCGACHIVPGVRGAVGDVGPRLDRMLHHIYVAGKLPNNAENLARWIADPLAIDPQSAMPDLNVSEADARDIASYLYVLPQE